MGEVVNGIFVLAGSYDQFKAWQRAQFEERHEATYINRQQELMGLRNMRLILVGSWYSRVDAEEIIENAQVRGWEIIHNDRPA